MDKHMIVLVLLLPLLGPVMTSFGNGHDPHSGAFCWDISKWGPIFYKQKPMEVCVTTFEKKCEDITKELTEDVTDTICDLQLYTDCKMRSDLVTFDNTKERVRKFPKIDCIMVPAVEVHNKTRPKCFNETKWNCISDWILNANGEKVFQKVGECTPMTWMNCTLETYEEPITIAKPNCTENGDVCWTDCSPVEDEHMVDHIECEVKSTTSCEQVSKPVTSSITYQECWEEEVLNCTEKVIEIPCQKKLHRKQCLLPEDHESNPDSHQHDEEDGSVEMVRCADDENGPRIGILKASKRDESKSESNPVPSYGLPSAPAIKAPSQRHKSVSALYGSPPPAPTQDFDYPLPNYASQNKRHVQTNTYQSNYGDAVLIDTIAKRQTIRALEEPKRRFPRYL